MIAICSSISAATLTTVAPESSLSVGPAVAEDPRVAVLVGADLPTQAERRQSRLESDLGARIAGVLEVVLDTVEHRLRLGVLDLEPGDDERSLPLALRMNAIGRSVGANAKPA